MFIYTVAKDIKAMPSDNAADIEKYGNRFWASVKEIGKPVMFNARASYLNAGQVIIAEEQSEKTSSKGTAYLMLKKTKLAESGKTEEKAESPPINAGNFQLIYSELRKQTAMLEKLIGDQDEPTPPDEPEPDVEPIIDDVDDEIDINSIPFK